MSQTNQKKGDFMTARKRRRYSNKVMPNPFALLVVGTVLVPASLNYVIQNWLPMSLLIIFLVALHIGWRKHQHTRQEERKEELRKSQSPAQRKIIQKMICYLNDILGFEKHSLSSQERKRKRQLKDAFLHWHHIMQTRYVYIIQEDSNGLVKIGKANNPLERVVRGLGAKSPYRLRVIQLIPTNVPFDVEKWFHHTYRSCRVNGEWFQLSAETIQKIVSGDYPLELMELLSKDERTIRSRSLAFQSD